LRRRLRDPAGRVAVVTGGSGGIGVALGAALARRGMALALVARRPDALDDAAERLSRHGTRVTRHPCDVADAAAVASALADAARSHGRVDLVAACAGVGRHAPFAEHGPAETERLVGTNLLGHVHTLRAALPHLTPEGGWIVSLSSVAGRLGQPDESLYSATKFAVTGLCEALTVELAPRGIHLLTVYPGFVRTGFVPPEEMSRVPASALRTAVEPEDVARATVRALERGWHEVTVPRLAAGGYVVRTLAPPLFRRILARMRPS